MDDCVAFKTSDSLVFFGSLAAFYSGVWHLVGHARGPGYLSHDCMVAVRQPKKSEKKFSLFFR